ncbi:MAG: redoxin domain-containing protein [Gemmatimonadota bacterium]
MIEVRWAALPFVALLSLPGAASGQVEEYPLLEVGDMAPDFALPGATRFGILRDPVRLSDFRGQTVVLAFFFQARTPG